MHVSGFGCELSSAQVPNVYCAGKYESAFSRSNTDSLGVILYTRTGFENQFTLNGNASLIPAIAFNNVPGTAGELKVARIFFNTTDVPIGSYNLIENTGDIFGMGLIEGSSVSGASYGYLSESAGYPEDRFYYANVLKNNQKYDEAIEQFELFIR